MVTVPTMFPWTRCPFLPLVGDSSPPSRKVNSDSISAAVLLPRFPNQAYICNSGGARLRPRPRGPPAETTRSLNLSVNSGRWPRGELSNELGRRLVAILSHKNDFPPSKVQSWLGAISLTENGYVCVRPVIAFIGQLRPIGLVFAPTMAVGARGGGWRPRRAAWARRAAVFTGGGMARRRVGGFHGGRLRRRRFPMAAAWPGRISMMAVVFTEVDFVGGEFHGPLDFMIAGPYFGPTFRISAPASTPYDYYDDMTLHRTIRMAIIRMPPASHYVIRAGDNGSCYVVQRRRCTLRMGWRCKPRQVVRLMDLSVDRC